MADLNVSGQRELRDLARALRAQEDGQARRKQLVKELRGAARPLVPAIRTAIKSLPSQGESKRRGRRPLKRSLSSSVTISVRLTGRSAGVSVFMNPRKLPDGQKSLAMYMEGVPGYLLLRHPLFGDREHWFAQGSHAGYFTRSIAGAEQAAAHRVAGVIETTAREIESS